MKCQVGIHYLRFRFPAVSYSGAEHAQGVYSKYGENLNCPLCDVKEDTTEHVLSCTKMQPHQLTQDDLYNAEDIGLLEKNDRTL